jgi:ornithine cyclodeaminase
MTAPAPQIKLRLINGHEVRELLPMDRCIELMRRAFTVVSEGRAEQPIRQMVRTQDGAGMMGWMPGFTADPPGLGLKLVTIFPGAVAKGIKSHQGVVMMFDAEDGRPLGVMDAAEITGIRTAAATAVATDALARPDASSLSIFGLGEQASTHLESLTRVRKFTRVRVWGRDSKKLEAFCKAQGSAHGVALEPELSAEAAADADVLCLVTGAREPFFQGAWLRAGQHLNAVGSSIPATSEIDAETVRRARYFVDYRDSALALSGDFLRAKAAGVIDDSHMLGEIGEVLLGRTPGRRNAEDITLFKSLGMAAEDLVSADWILKEAARLDRGVVIDW